MSDWKNKLRGVKRQMDRDKTATINLPASFNFKSHTAYDFDEYLKFFDWSLHDQPVRVDFSKCKSANYQALTLLILYFWRLRAKGCRITTDLDDDAQGASEMWRKMGAVGLFHVTTDDNVQFRGSDLKPLIAIRNTRDFKDAISTAEGYTEEFDVEYTNTLRYVLSELLYNTLEHGVSSFMYRGVSKRMPSLIQFTWYVTRNEISFIVADIGVGIREHLSQTYADIESDEDALRLAIQPNVSGTFGRSDPYKGKNNAGVGLFISSNIVRRLNADMHIVSGHGEMHISPRDTTTKTLSSYWPGTFVLVTIRVDVAAKFALHSMMQEFREEARKELSKGKKTEDKGRYFLSVYNYFGAYAEDKQSAIKHRDKYLMPALNDGKSILVDFDGVNYAPHSFLSALLATPIKSLGMTAYKKIKIINATPDIRETVDFILDENTEENNS